MDQGGKLSRRDLAKRAAKLGVAGAAVAWVAPHFEDVAYAAGSTGSPPPGPTTTTRKGGPKPGPEYPTCQSDPRVFFDLPHSVHVWGAGWAPSSKLTLTLVGVKVLGTVTVGPNGKFDVRYTIPAGLKADTLYRISVSGYGKNGHPYRCGVAIFIDQRCKGAVQARPGAQVRKSSAIPLPGSSGGGGVDTRSVVLMGAGALVAGKTLYSLRRNVASNGDLTIS